MANKLTNHYAAEKALIPTLEKTSSYFNFRNGLLKRRRLLSKIESQMVLSSQTNRAYMNVLILMWEK